MKKRAYEKQIQNQNRAAEARRKLEAALEQQRELFQSERARLILELEGTRAQLEHVRGDLRHEVEDRKAAEALYEERLEALRAVRDNLSADRERRLADIVQLDRKATLYKVILDTERSLWGDVLTALRFYAAPYDENLRPMKRIKALFSRDNEKGQQAQELIVEIEKRLSRDFEL